MFRSVLTLTSRCGPALRRGGQKVSAAKTVTQRSVDRFSSSHSAPQPGVRGAKVLRLDEESLTISLGPEKTSERFSMLWLRDHCRCPQCYNAKTFQRRFDVRKLFPAVTADGVVVDGDVLRMTWSDGHESEYPLSWLNDNSFGSFRTRLTAAYGRRKVWQPSEFQSLPIARIPVENLLNDPDESFRRKAFGSLWDYGVMFIENVEPNPKATQAALETIGPLMKSMWGDTPHVFEANDERSDSAYSTEYIGCHTDHTYFTEAAGIILLSCYHHDGVGGETALVDGLAVADRFWKENPEGFEFFTKHAIPSEYREETATHKHHYVTNDYLFKLDPVTGDLVQIRYNTYDRGPMSNLSADTAKQFYYHYEKLGQIIDDMEKESWFKLKPGTVALINNWRVLHGRSAFTGRRVMVSAYISRGDYLSGARTLGLIPY